MEQEDLERLPTGFTRIAYDADTEVYTYRDRDGNLWEGAPGCRYGTLRPADSFSPYLCPRYVPQSDSAPGGFTYFPDTWDPPAEEESRSADSSARSRLVEGWHQLRRDLLRRTSHDAEVSSLSSNGSSRPHSVLSSTSENHKDTRKRSSLQKLKHWRS